MFLDQELIVFTTKQVSGLKIFFDIKRCDIVEIFIGDVRSIDDFVLLIVVDDKVSSVSRQKNIYFAF